MVFKWIQGRSQIQCFARNSLSLLSKSSTWWRGGRSADSYIKAWHSPPTNQGSHLPKLDLGITNPAPAPATDTNPLSSTNSPRWNDTTQHIERNKHNCWGYLKTYHRPPLRWMFNPRQSRMSTWMNDWLWATNLSWAGLQYASRERGSSAISQNYPPLGKSSLFEEKTSAKEWVLNIGRALFSMWTSGGYTRWPENIQRAIKYPEIGISRYPRLRNGEMLQQQGAFCIVTNGLADGLNRGKRMKGGEEEGNDYPSLISKGP